ERSGRISSFAVSECRLLPTRCRRSSGESSATATPENTRPTTDARSTTTCSSSASRSRRAASRAWMLGGIVSAERLPATVQTPSRQPLEQLPDGPERLLHARRDVGQTEEGGHPFADEVGVRAGEEREELAASLLRLVELADARRVAEHLDHRPVGDAFPVGQA